MEPQIPFPHSKKSKQSESGFQMFLQENNEAVHSEHPNINITKINYMSNKYNQLPASEQQIYASRAASQNQIPAVQSKKKKALTRSGDGSPNNTPYISQSNASNYSPQESQHFSIQLNQYNQQGSHPQISNNQRQYINSNYQSINSNLPVQTIQPKTNQIQSVTPKKRITKPIKKKQDSESSESDDESDSTYQTSTNQQQPRRPKMPSIFTKQSQNGNQTQLSQPNFFYSQPQINPTFSSQQKSKQKIPKPTTNLPTPYQQNQNIQIQDHRIQYDQNEPKIYMNRNPKPVQASLNNDSYSTLQTNQLGSQRQPDPKFYRDIEKTLDEESVDLAKEEQEARNLLNDFEFKSNFYFSMTPFDCNCLENYPTSFIGK